MLPSTLPGVALPGVADHTTAPPYPDTPTLGYRQSGSEARRYRRSFASTTTCEWPPPATRGPRQDPKCGR